MANAFPLIVLAGGAALLLKKKKKKTKKAGGETLPEPPGPGPSPEPTPPGPVPGPGPTPPVPGDQVQPGKIQFTGSTSTKNYGLINWRVRLYGGGPSSYVEIFDPDDQEFEVATTNKMEDGPVLLFPSVEDAKQWTVAFINSVDANAKQPEPPPQPPKPQPKPERGEALNLKPGTYSDVGSYSRYGLLAPYRTPATTVSVRRKSGMVWYPAKQDEARFAGWNPKNSEEALVDIDAKGEYSIIALDGGPNGVFIAEWILKATQD